MTNTPLRHNEAWIGAGGVNSLHSPSSHDWTRSSPVFPCSSTPSSKYSSEDIYEWIGRRENQTKQTNRVEWKRACAEPARSPIDSRWTKKHHFSHENYTRYNQSTEIINNIMLILIYLICNELLEFWFCFLKSTLVQEETERPVANKVLYRSVILNTINYYNIWRHLSIIVYHEMNLQDCLR